MNIVLAVCTYRRPDGLLKLLEALTSLNDIEGLSVVVADNDKAGEGIAVCKALPADYPIPVETIMQTSSGISAVRNAVAHKALSLEPDIVAFLDDDEWPEPQWLSEHLRIMQEHNADVVGGPTRPEFPPHADPALHDNPYYGADLQLPDGSACQLQAGGNFVIKARVLQQYAPSFFHEDFSHTGSEDLAFFTQLAHDGHRMFWAARAVVYEPVPESRLAPDWLQQRVVNIHNSRVRVMQRLQPSARSSLVRFIKTFALMCTAGLMTIVGCVIPGYRKEAQLLRWKFTGKMTAHLGETVKRRESY